MLGGCATHTRVHRIALAALAASLMLVLAPSAAIGAIANVQTGNEATSLNSNVTPTLFAPSTVGDLLIASVLNDCTTSNKAFSAPAGWILAKSLWLSGDGDVELWYYPNNPGGISNAAFTSSPCTGSAGQLSEWSGAALSGALDKTGTGTAAAATSVMVSSSGSTTVNGELAITAFETSMTEFFFGPGFGWNQLFTDPNRGYGSDDTLPLSIGTASESPTAWNNNAKWVAVIATFEPLQPPGPVTGLTAAAGANQATVSWTAPSAGGASSYVVTALSGGSAPRNTTAIAGGATSTTITGLAAGISYKFSVYAVNAAGTGATTTTASSVMPTGVPSPFAAAVLADSPLIYWRLDETAGIIGLDSSGNGSTSTEVGAPTQGSAGLLATDTDRALGLNGSSQYFYGNTSYVNPTTFSIEAWFKTAGGYGSGGQIVGMRNSQSTTATKADRLVYMTNSGQLYFGVYPGAVKTIHSTGSYNDGNPHQVVATLSGAGMFLYVDGTQVASDPTTTSADTYTGWWRAGEDDLSGWVNPPTSDYLHGTIDEVSVYPTALSLQRVQVHYCDGADVNCLSTTAPATVAFSPVTLNGTNQTRTAAASFDVTDNTGGTGWSLLATSITFTTGTRQLPATATTIASAPSSACDSGFTCTAPTSSGVSYPYTLPAAGTAPTATKLVNAAAASGMGHETITPTFTLTVPGGAYVGAYTSTWTFTLSSGP